MSERETSKSGEERDADAEHDAEHDDEHDDEHDADADAEPDAEPEAPAEPAAPTDATPPPSPPKVSKLTKLWWLLPVAVVVEFWIYGRNGTIEVCVGKQGETDFALVGQARTDDNRWQFPRCETRLNLGLRSEYEDKVQDATKVACRGATLFKNRGQAAQCEAEQQGWQHHVDARFCPPWDRNYYEHLFWFLK